MGASGLVASDTEIRRNVVVVVLPTIHNLSRIPVKLAYCDYCALYVAFALLSLTPMTGTSVCDRKRSRTAQGGGRLMRYRSDYSGALLPVNGTCNEVQTEEADC